MELYFLIVLVVLAVVLVASAIIIVPQGYQYTLERFGRYVESFKAGFHIIIPFMYSIGEKVNMMEQVIDVPSQEVITRDNAMVKVDGVVFFQIMDASKATYMVNDLEWAIINLTLTNIRTVMGSMELDELLSKRETINANLLTVVDEATDPWGVKVTRIEIKDIAPPRDLIESMGRQMKAEREKRASILEAEGQKQAKVLKAEGERESQILFADGEKQAAFKAAEARERQAEADAKATTMVSDAIAKGDIKAINFFIAKEYVKSLEAIGSADNQKVIFMPLEASNLMGAIGGIAELTKDVKASNPKAREKLQKATSKKLIGKEPANDLWQE